MPSDITPDPDGNQTLIRPSGPDVLNAASAAAFLQRIADKTTRLSRAASAHVTLANSATSEGNTMPTALVTSCSRGATGWSLSDSNRRVHVPETGIYTIHFLGLVDASADTNYLEIALLIEAAAFGWAFGPRYSDNAIPVQCIGMAQFEITDPTTQRLSFSPTNGTSVTPAAEVDPGRSHSILITRIGDLP